MSKSLICITTCKRIDLIKKYILPYINFTRSNEEFEFLLAQDGSLPDYESFTDDFKIPMISSEKREGVGLSKNRVLESFPNYSNYFFLDDDVELVDPSIFLAYVTFNRKNEFHHLSSTRFFDLKENDEINGHSVNFGDRGGGYFNFFTRTGLERVGGWHTDFAKWKRYGHTEHSYRFVNAGLQKYPFIVLADSIDKVIIHSPDHVSEPLNELVDPADELFLHEKELIAKKLKYFPLKTISKYQFNGYSMREPGNEKLVELIKLNDRYALIQNKKEKCQAKVEFKVHQLKTSSSLFEKLKLLSEILILGPTNKAFKHWIKQKIKRTKH